jgi:hypothetical protein
MKNFLLGFGVLVALLAPPLSTDAFACSCAETPTIAASLSQSDAVFSGQVVALDTFRVRMHVDKVWKGETRSEVTLLTGVEDLGNGMMRSNSCNYSYRAGETYVIFASGTSDKLMARGCSRTAVAKPADLQDLDAVVNHKKVGAEIRACSGTNEIRIATANPDSQAIPAVTLTAEGSGKKYGALTDRSGKTTFTGLQPGEYKITASAEGHLAKQSTVNVTANACVEAALYLVPNKI